MAEKSLLWDTNGTGDGTGTGFTETDMIQLFRSLFTRTANMGGVAPDFLNELAVTGTATPVAVNTGAGLCYGIPYWNTASVNVTIATPAVSTRVDRIVLRADWTLQTVRITRIAGTEGAGAPAMTQSAGTTWDIPLATVSITTGAVITVTDAREWVLGTGDATIDSTKLATDAVTTAKILDANVTAAKLADGAALAEILDDDGAGSGLDADLLDGSHAAAFAAAAHTHEVDQRADMFSDAEGDPAAIGAAADGTSTYASRRDHVHAFTGTVDPRTGLAGTNGVIADSANGDARGTDAVDLQTIRSSSTYVASGNASVVAGGEDNQVTGAHSAIGGGKSGNISSAFGVVAGGQFGVVGGAHASVGGGYNNVATGEMAAVSGGREATADKYGQEAHASGIFAANGDAQRSIYTARNSTSNNTQTELFLNGSSARMTVASDATWAFRALIVARRTDADNESAAYEITGCIDNNAGTTALVGSITKTVIAEDTAGWDVTAEADNTNDALVFKVTGENAKTIRWVATVWTTEVTG